MPFTGTYTGIGVLPRVLSANTPTQQSVRCVFNEAMFPDAELTDATNYVLTPAGGSDARTVLSVGIETSTSVILLLDGLLTPGTNNYTLTVAIDGPNDIAGNTIDPAFRTAVFGFAGVAAVVPPNEDPVPHIGLLNPERWESGLGIGWCSYGASDDMPQGLESPMNHEVLARRRLIAQYSDKPRMIATAEIEGVRFQELENIVYTLINQRGLDSSWGFLLELVGERVGFTRQGREDNTYRALLAGHIMANVSRATPEEVRGILDMLMQGLYDVRLIEAPPGCTLLRTAQLRQDEGEVFSRIVNKGVPIGTRAIIEWELPVELGETFGFENDNSVGPFAEFGEDPSGAGLWAEGSDGGF